MKNVVFYIQAGSGSAPPSRVVNQLLGVLASLTVIAAAVLIYFIVSRTRRCLLPATAPVHVAPIANQARSPFLNPAPTALHARLGPPTALLQSTAPDGSDLSASVTSVRQAFSRFEVPGVVTAYA